MRQKIGLIFLVVSVISLISMGLNFAQEEAVPEETITQNPLPEPEAQWVWAEVVSVDTSKNELSVKYLDYETNQEKEIVVNVDDKTTYEVIKSLDEIKPQDTVSIDYIISAEGKNIAKNISVEKPEGEQAPAEGGVPEVSPEDLQSAPTTEQ